MQFTAIYHKSRNFTPCDLMRDHARLKNGASFHYDKFFTPYILYAGTRYYYDHWRIENGSPDSDYIAVTVFLKMKGYQELKDGGLL